jgi:preprotein translocase subunit SecE
LPERAFLKTMKNLFSRLKEYLHSSLLELKKVNWPSRKETVKNTVSVLVLSLVLALILGVMDYFFLNIVRIIIK